MNRYEEIPVLPEPTGESRPWAGLISAAFVFVVVALVLRKSAPLKRITDGLLLAIPWVGGVFRTISAADYASTLAALYETGVPVFEALDWAAEAVGGLISSDIDTSINITRNVTRNADAKADTRIRDSLMRGKDTIPPGRYRPFSSFRIVKSASSRS